HDDLLVGKVSVLHSWLTSFSPKGMPHITKVMCCFIYLWDLLLKGRLIMGMARCGEPSPFLRVGVVPSRQESLRYCS
ncbi:hypothetical protein, partial [Klebsiella quasivariicola]